VLVNEREARVGPELPHATEHRHAEGEVGEHPIVDGRVPKPGQRIDADEIAKAQTEEQRGLHRGVATPCRGRRSGSESALDVDGHRLGRGLGWSSQGEEWDEQQAKRAVVHAS
jgi:hypothetical protein